MKHRKRLTAAFAAAALLLPLAASGVSAADQIPVGQLVAQTGATAPVAKVYGQGIVDAFTFINQNGGINGKKINLQTVDYGYDPSKAISTYKSWKDSLKPVAIQGWGTADTEALIDLTTKDKVVFMSGSSSGHLTDPTGRSPWTSTPAPFNFFYGPSYSDGCRALVQFAAEEWRSTGTAQRGSTFLGDLNRPKFAYLGDNHPYPNSPKAACTEYARDLGFEIVPPIRYSLSPGDYSAQCQTLKQVGANFAFLANTAESNVQLLKDCAKLGVATQFMTNIYGWDEGAGQQAGDAGNGLIWVVSVARWGDDVPGMKTVREVSQVSDSSGDEKRSVHYIRGVCSAFLMRDAMQTAAEKGGVTGENIKAAFEQMRDHVPAGLEGVCLPTTWTPTDHRGTTTVMLYRNDYNFGTVTQTRVYTTTIPLRPDWLGW
ncbi:MAG: ABC transporter substrate-binding protein [Rhodospirillales bacterium]|nr:ABC transporter substrate-binding protein [Rhodospirillales bacterium]